MVLVNVEVRGERPMGSGTMPTRDLIWNTMSFWLREREGGREHLHVLFPHFSLCWVSWNSGWFFKWIKQVDNFSKYNCKNRNVNMSIASRDLSKGTNIFELASTTWRYKPENALLGVLPTRKNFKH